MNKENTLYLFERYPLLFPKESRGNLMGSLMAFGFECGDGWFNLINSLCAIIQEHIDDKRDPESYNHIPDYPQVEVVQVKEKYGGLRFYTISCTDEVQSFIDAAEAMSYHTCDVCGTTKDVVLTEGWMQVICKKCLDEKTHK